MPEMELSKIIIDEKHQDQVVVLKEKKGMRILPIIIGFQEASSIRMKLAGIKPPLPLTHDLLQAVIEGLEAKAEKIIIDKLENTTFHAKLILKMNDGQIKIIDARPSDCIAIAVRAKAPIFVEEEILKSSLETNQ